VHSQKSVGAAPPQIVGLNIVTDAVFAKKKLKLSHWLDFVITKVFFIIITGSFGQFRACPKQPKTAFKIACEFWYILILVLHV